MTEQRADTMEQERKGFVFLRSYYECVAVLPPEERLEALEGMLRYGLYGEEPSLSNTALAVFIAVRPNIDHSVRNYAAQCANGAKGGRPKKQPKETPPEPEENPNETQPKPDENPNETQPKPNQNPTETLERERAREKKMKKNSHTDTDAERAQEGESDADGPEGTFNPQIYPPSPMDILRYAGEKGLDVKVDPFYYHYTNNDWRMKGGDPVKDWRIALRRWCERNQAWRGT
ncbi:MAG: hypothetical protein IJ751_05955 [Oscillospiraceae bacterium]|nr:hypothetical protein [Oscillospiraceae bacterium]